MGTPALEACTEPPCIPEGGGIYRPPLERRLLLASILGIGAAGSVLFSVFVPIERSIQEGTVGFFIESLALCLLVVGILLWAAVAGWRMRLLVARRGLVYHGHWGMGLAATWDKVECVETRVYNTRYGTTSKRGLLLDTSGWYRFITLEDFDPSWGGGDLGWIVRRYAPQAFGGQPVPPALPPTGDADRLSTKRLPTGLVVAVVEVLLAAGTILYAVLQ